MSYVDEQTVQEQEVTEEVLQDQEQDKPVCYIDSRTKILFEDMLNKLGPSVKIGTKQLKYGKALSTVDPEEFLSLYNIWVTKCLDKHIMKKNPTTNYKHQIQWSSELSEIEMAYQGMEILKEIL